MGLVRITEGEFQGGLDDLYQVKTGEPTGIEENKGYVDTYCFLRDEQIQHISSSLMWSLNTPYNLSLFVPGFNQIQGRFPLGFPQGERTGEWRYREQLFSYLNGGKTRKRIFTILPTTAMYVGGEQRILVFDNDCRQVETAEGIKKLNLSENAILRFDRRRYSEKDPLDEWTDDFDMEVTRRPSIGSSPLCIRIATPGEIIDRRDVVSGGLVLNLGGSITSIISEG